MQQKIRQGELLRFHVIPYLSFEVLKREKRLTLAEFSAMLKSQDGSPLTESGIKNYTRSTDPKLLPAHIKKQIEDLIKYPLDKFYYVQFNPEQNKEEYKAESLEMRQRVWNVLDWILTHSPEPLGFERSKVKGGKQAMTHNDLGILMGSTYSPNGVQFVKAAMRLTLPLDKALWKLPRQRFQTEDGKIIRVNLEYIYGLSDVMFVDDTLERGAQNKVERIKALTDTIKGITTKIDEIALEMLEPEKSSGNQA